MKHPPSSPPPVIVRGGLQVFPLRAREEFDDEDEFWDYLDEVNRYNNGLRPKAAARDRPPRTTAPDGCHRQVGLKLALADYELLEQIAGTRRMKPQRSPGPFWSAPSSRSGIAGRADRHP